MEQIRITAIKRWWRLQNYPLLDKFPQIPNALQVKKNKKKCSAVIHNLVRIRSSFTNKSYIITLEVRRYLPMTIQIQNNRSNCSR